MPRRTEPAGDVKGEEFCIGSKEGEGEDISCTDSWVASIHTRVVYGGRREEGRCERTCAGEGSG